MEQWLRDEIAKEQGYTICPLRIETYTMCDQKCEECEEHINYKKWLEENNNHIPYID